MNYIRIASAIAATVGAAQAGIVVLPGLDDYTRAILAFGLGLVATFFSVLLMEDKPTA